LVILSDGIDDAPGGMTVEEVEAHLAENPVPLYAIGFSRMRDAAQRERGLATLGRLARRSGGQFVDASAGDPGAAYAAMRQTIGAVQRIQLRCPTCTADGNRYRLQIALDSAGLTLSDGVDVRLYPVAVDRPEDAAAASPEAPDAPDAPAAVEATPPSTAPPESPAADGPEPNRPPGEPTSPVASEAPPDSGGTPPAEEGVSSLVSAMPWWLGALAVGVLALVLAVLIGLRRRRSRRAGDATIPSPAIEPPLTEPSPPSQAVVEPHTSDESNRPPSAPPPAAGTPIVLTIKNGPRRGEAVRLVLAPSALIGRAGACGLALREDDEVSGQHARLTAQGGRILLADIGSTNGTQLNGVPLTAPTPVHDGDVVRVGQTDLHIGGVGRW
jgi:hypothetical protein